MRGGSAERLVARSSRNNAAARAKVSKYLTIILASLLCLGGSALLFLVPLYADPALSALAADFDPQPAECVTERRDELSGLDNCTWSSCREGCTSDAYRCTQIHARYKTDSTVWRSAVLLVNIKGCGYPPNVNCHNFTENYGRLGARYPCYWSRADDSLVIPQWSRSEQVSMISKTLLMPLLIATAAGVGLCALHCECRPRSRRRRRIPTHLPSLYSDYYRTP